MGKYNNNATRTGTIAGKKYSGKANAIGNYKNIHPCETQDTSVGMTAKDSSGNISAARVKLLGPPRTVRSREHS